MKTDNDITLYILMRTDLPSQGAGRACAQASHATSCLEHDYRGNKLLKQWKEQTQYGYGTCIVLGASRTEIMEILTTALGTDFPSDWCIDPDYAISISSELNEWIDPDRLKKTGAYLESLPDDPKRLILHREERTCAYILGSKANLAPYLGHLPLYQG